MILFCSSWRQSMTDINPIRDLLEPLSGHAERNEGTGLTPADLFCLVDDTLPVRGGQTRPFKKNQDAPDRG